MAKKKLSPRAVRVKAAAMAAFGDRGLTKLAHASGLSKQLLSFIVAGKRDVTDDVYQTIAGTLINESIRLRQTAGKIDRMVERMMRELKLIKE